MLVAGPLIGAPDDEFGIDREVGHASILHPRCATMNP
jgi:hypothetical protein